MSKKRKRTTENSQVEEDAERLKRLEEFTGRAIHQFDREYKNEIVLRASRGQLDVKRGIEQSRQHICFPKTMADSQSVEANRLLYPWSPSDKNTEYPPHIDDDKLPEAEDLSVLGLKDIHTVFVATEAAAHALSLWPRYSSLNDVPILGSRRAYLEQNWDSDALFGSLRLHGPNPSMIQKVSNLDDFVARERIRETKEGPLFIEDYRRRLSTDPLGTCLVAPLTLFQLQSNGELKPLAIQLTETQTYFPGDPSWQFAKAAANSSYFVYHELVSHLLLTHLVVEIAIVTTYQTLPPFHPVAGLLRDHFYRTLALNRSARSTLVPKLLPRTGVPLALSRALLKRAWTDDFQWAQLVFPREVQRRLGSYTPQELKEKFPTYFYVHDGLALWDLLLEYHTQVLTLIYGTDTGVNSDPYLKDWWRMLQSKIPGFFSTKDKEGKEEDALSLTSVIEVVTTFVFVATVQHSAMNYPQETYFQNARSCPTLLQGPLPSNPTSADLLRALPSKLQVSIAYAIVTILSAPVGNDNIVSSFGSYTSTVTNHAFDVHVHTQHTFLLPRLQELQQRIQAQQQEAFYPYLLPDRVAKSIFI